MEAPFENHFQDAEIWSMAHAYCAWPSSQRFQRRCEYEAEVLGRISEQMEDGREGRDLLVNQTLRFGIESCVNGMDGIKCTNLSPFQMIAIKCST